ncbi:uncharacterized protein LOC142354888 [Convolutriloba macropyga]|uniref:uncharacterized protein LOC142354888 n=1 Tax=Convolutriloba macropyga TaxID=536237 RepID=UPI003F5281E0
MTRSEDEPAVRTPGRGYFDAKTAVDRFQQPRASLTYDKQGRAVFGLPEGGPVLYSKREQFEQGKYEENLRKQAEQLAPSLRKQSLKVAYEENLRVEAQRIEEKAARVRDSRVGTNHHLYRMSEDNPLRVSSTVDMLPEAAQEGSEPPKQGIARDAHRNMFQSTDTLGIYLHPDDPVEQERRRKASEEQELNKMQAAIEEKIYSENPHGLTPAQQRQFRDQGLRIGGLGFGDISMAPRTDRRVLR